MTSPIVTYIIVRVALALVGYYVVRGSSIVHRRMFALYDFALLFIGFASGLLSAVSQFFMGSSCSTLPLLAPFLPFSNQHLCFALCGNSDINGVCELSTSGFGDLSWRRRI
jgi:hypothetical protein